MTSTVLQPAATTTSASSTAESSAMGWSHDKLRFSCVDNIGLKQLWKLIALDTNSNNKTTESSSSTATKNANEENMANSNNNNNNNNNENLSYENCENITDYLGQRDFDAPSRMSLLKFLAINALELSAPATPVLLQQQQQQINNNNKPSGWLQLSGHPESIVPCASGVVRKRVASFSDYEVLSYQQLSQEPLTSKIIPDFYGNIQLESGEMFIELQDLLKGFKDPCVMDIKMGCRTFLESEVSNKTLRPDLYQKMIKVDPQAPTAEEHAQQAITKLRYMLFREAMSSSQSKGFRIEAIRLKGKAPMKDLKTVRSSEQIAQTIDQFLNSKKCVQKELIKRLKHMRSVIEKSPFFQTHEIVGSSIFIVYDDVKVGCWLIDFAKSRPLPDNVKVNHRSDWIPGNREEGLLKGMDELIHAFESANQKHQFSRKFLQI
ncbi:inositol-trisphosphate 3-kinase homolog [Stomoxys calcitrans]|uniref:Kinase n=1 Tax=Stomoxys calcitrans TaxID=35570 RepID=A0A1I8PHU8_STOCA|nr:inositol-trisphosphate 3-kinase homolog [Stomoxys calcitrans]